MRIHVRTVDVFPEALPGQFPGDHQPDPVGQHLETLLHQPEVLRVAAGDIEAVRVHKGDLQPFPLADALFEMVERLAHRPVPHLQTQQMKLLLLPARAAEEQRRKGAQHQPEVAPQRPVHLFAVTQRPLNRQPSRPVDEIGRENSGPVEAGQLRLKVAQRVPGQPDPARQHISETRRTAPQRRLRPHFRQPQRTPGKIEHPPETQLSAQRAKQQAGH